MLASVCGYWVLPCTIPDTGRVFPNYQGTTILSYAKSMPRSRKGGSDRCYHWNSIYPILCVKMNNYPLWLITHSVSYDLHDSMNKGPQSLDVARSNHQYRVTYTKKLVCHLPTDMSADDLSTPTSRDAMSVPETVLQRPKKHLVPRWRAKS